MNSIPVFWTVLKGFLVDKKKNSESTKYKSVAFENHGRSSNIVYIEGNKSIRFYSELGGGKCIFYIDIPPANQWEKQTGLKLSERDGILEYIAKETFRQQVSTAGVYYKIGERHILFMEP